MAQPHVLEIAIAPKQSGDLVRLLAGLGEIARDEAIAFAHDRDTGQIILKGGSEHDLDAAIDALRKEIALDIGAPQVAYRETLTRRVETDYTHKTRSGGIGEFARVKMLFEPARGAGASFMSRIAGGAVPQAFMPGVEQGIASVMAPGILAGFPVIDVKVTLLDGAYHDTDSSARAFEIAARGAFRDALKGGGATLLEPIMRVRVTTPEDFSGFVLGDLGARHGKVHGREARGDALVIDARVPLSNLLGYAGQLRSGTQGRGRFTMAFSHYAPLPPPGDGPAAPAIALRV